MPLPLPTNSSQTSYYIPLQHSTQQLHRTYQYLHIGPVHGYTITHTCNIYKTCSLHEATKQTARTSLWLDKSTCNLQLHIHLRLRSSPACTTKYHTYIIQTTTHLSWIHLLSILSYITSTQSFFLEPQRYVLPHCYYSITCIELHPDKRWVGRRTKSMLPNEQIIMQCKVWHNNHLLLDPMAVRYHIQNVPLTF